LSALSLVGGIVGPKAQRGMLFEYTLSNILVLEFEFNPSSITRTRTVSIKTGGLPGTRGGYDFMTPSEALRAAQGVIAEPESFSVKILLDATDRMETGDITACSLGIQPEIDMIRTMLEPKSQQPLGAKILSALGGSSGEKSFPQYQSLPVLIFKWGIHMLPVFLTRVEIISQQYLPSLIPYRAEATLSMQIIESRNPFYAAEIARQTAMAMLSSKPALASSLISSIKGVSGV
jgi:hypothetical protein